MAKKKEKGIHEAPVSPITGRPMVRGTKPKTIAYKGETMTFDMPGWYCEESGESIHTGADMKVSDRALHTLKAKALNLLQPKTVRRIRKRLKLTQKDAGMLIGGGPNAFQKYENGDVLVSRGICSSLRLLDANPEGMKILIAQHSKKVTA